MLSIFLVAAGAWLLFGGVDAARVVAVWDSIRSKVDGKKALAAALIVAALLLLPSWNREVSPTPVPDAGPLSLKGAFSGASASDDAILVGSLLLELADELEYDGSQSEPSIRTGVQVDHLRRVARVLRCKGESIGDRQPEARDKIAAYLEAHVGTDGGPLTPEARAAWISAFRDVGRAAADASK